MNFGRLVDECPTIASLRIGPALPRPHGHGDPPDPTGIWLPFRRRGHHSWSGEVYDAVDTGPRAGLRERGQSAH